MKRALRVDKITLAALGALLPLYANPERLVRELPALRRLVRPEPEVRASAERVAADLRGRFGGSVEVVACASRIGSGALPVDTLPSAGIALRPPPPAGGRGSGRRVEELAATLRALPLPVIGRIREGALVLDLRCLDRESDLLGGLSPAAFRDTFGYPGRRERRAAPGRSPEMLIATAGHVDHGKTVLVKALTGVDTDRLPEEKARGLSIDLGFAYHTRPDGGVLGFVDVPGHERFIRNMLAGVAAIDYALLVVAADDGPMPQTREHLAILDLLGVNAGAVVVTKIDLADDAQTAAVIGRIEKLVEGTGLEGAPVFPVSAVSGAGMTPLHDHLAELAAERRAARVRTGTRFRLAVDRCFTVRGAGVVVTGAVFSGEVAVGDRLVLAPAGTGVRVRRIHAQSRPAERGTLGERCAINLAGTELGRTDIRRGDWLTGEPAPASSHRFDAELRVLASEERPLAHWTPVHVHAGAASFTGRVAVLEGRSIAPGSRGLVQVVVDQPFVGVRGDRFILRDQSARRTVAGGAVLDPAGAVRGRARPERIAALRAVAARAPDRALADLLATSANGVDLDHFADAWNLRPEEAEALYERAGVEAIALPRGRTAGFARRDWNALLERILATVRRTHEEAPERAGAESAELAGAAGRSREVAAAAIGSLVRDGRLVREGRYLRVPEHEPRLSPRDAALWSKVSRHLGEEVVKPPVLADLAATLGVDRQFLALFLGRSAGRGLLVKVAPNRFFHPGAVRRLAEVAEGLAAAAEDGRFDAKTFRDTSGIGRNLTIQVLEYFRRSGSHPPYRRHPHRRPAARRPLRLIHARRSVPHRPGSIRRLPAPRDDAQSLLTRAAPAPRPGQSGRDLTPVERMAGPALASVRPPSMTSPSNQPPRWNMAPGARLSSARAARVAATSIAPSLRTTP